MRWNSATPGRSSKWERRLFLRAGVGRSSVPRSAEELILRPAAARPGPWPDPSGPTRRHTPQSL